MPRSSTNRDERLRRPAGIRSLQLSDTRVSFVPDGVVGLPPHGWLPESTDEDWTTHAAYLDDGGELVATIGGLLVENGERALLIDAGFGPESLPGDPSIPRGAIHGGDLLDNLALLGRRPEDIEAVAFTHLHTDHIGWALHRDPGSGRYPFGHAGYLVAVPEWADRHKMERAGITPEIVETLAPHVRTVVDGEEIFPNVRVRVSGGHTAGHAEYVITTPAARLIAFGDAMHTPVQISRPEWHTAVDHDPIEAAEHRRRLVDELTEPGTLGFGVHFADAQFGSAVTDGPERVWRFV